MAGIVAHGVQPAMIGERVLFFIVSVLLINPACFSEKHPTDVKSLIDYSINNMIFVQGGSYRMGDGYPVKIDGKEIVGGIFSKGSNKPLHKVTLDSYYLSRYEVTYSEYDIYSNVNGIELIGSNLYTPERAKARYERMKNPTPVSVRGGHYPIAPQSWFHAKDYCQWLGELTGLPFELPTEAQWEYAARSRGQNVLFATDNGELNKGRNFRPNFGGAERFGVVGTYPPSPMGFYEMTGNVGEWVNDWYDDEYYKTSPIHNPKGPEKSPYYKAKKTWRGGSNLGVDRNFIVTVRYGNVAHKRDPWVGMRCALQIKEKLTPRQIKKRIKWKKINPRKPVILEMIPYGYKNME